MICQLVTLAEARAQGLATYFTGRPCKHGHTALRSTKYSRCLACEVDRNKIRAGWREKNPERAKLLQARYRDTANYRRVIRRGQEQRRAARLKAV